MNLTQLSGLLTTYRHSPKRRRRRQTGQAVVAESLEQRALLSAAGVQDMEIAELHVRVNDRDFIITRSRQIIPAQPGDELQVTGVVYAGDPDAGQVDGVMAFEGYLRSRNAKGRSRFDYSNGRFGDPSTSDAISGATVSHPGLTGSWELREGMHRLVVSMVRYFGDEHVVEDRLAVNLQLATPDLVHHLKPQKDSETLRLGEEVRIRGAWMNNGGGVLENYSEVDVYRADDLTQPVWVGVLAGTARPGELVRGDYVNPGVGNDLPQVWTPDREGEYVLRFYGDPEGAAQEADESNNDVELTVEVTKKGKSDKLDLAADRFDEDSKLPKLKKRFQTLVNEVRASARNQGISSDDFARAEKKIRGEFNKLMKHVNKGEAEWADYAELDRLFSSLEAEALLLEW